MTERLHLKEAMSGAMAEWYHQTSNPGKFTTIASNSLGHTRTGRNRRLHESLQGLLLFDDIAITSVLLVADISRLFRMQGDDTSSGCLVVLWGS
jgi:hypothetical protein